MKREKSKRKVSSYPALETLKNQYLSFIIIIMIFRVLIFAAKDELKDFKKNVASSDSKPPVVEPDIFGNDDYDQSNTIFFSATSISSPVAKLSASSLYAKPEFVKSEEDIFSLSKKLLSYVLMAIRCESEGSEHIQRCCRTSS